MLYYPQDPKQNIGTIVGIDPGTNMLGFSVLQFDFRSLEILSVYGESFKSDRMIDEDSLIFQSHNERIAKIYAQRDNLIKQLNHYRPFVVACENPFINRFRPNAYGPLVEILFAIRTAVIEYDPVVDFITYEPSVIKKSVGAGATCGKEEVKTAILLNKELSPNEFTNLSHLDEHALDAVGVAYTHLIRFRKVHQK